MSYMRDKTGQRLDAITVGRAQRSALRHGYKPADATLLTSSQTLAATNSAGLSISGNVLSASTPGTEGRWWLPLFNQNASCKISATILASKATVGSYSWVQIADSALGIDPGSGTTTRSIGIGYFQGVGIVIRRSDGSGFDKVLLADASITDGQTYNCTFVFDNQLRATGAPNNPFWYGTVYDSSGNQLYTQAQFSSGGFSNMGTLVARTTVASGLTDVRFGQGLGDNVGFPAAMTSVKYTALNAAETASLRIPAAPNGRLVVVLHGRGGNDSTMFNSAQYEPTWKLLLANGYTLLMPNMGGNSWFTPSVRAQIADGVANVCSALNLDPTRVLLWGDSMGGGTALSLVGNQTLGAGNVAAVYAAEPVCDLDQVYVQNSTFTEIATLYPAQSDRQAASPINLPTANYTGVPILFRASTSDAVVVKTSNTDVMRTKIGGVTKAPLLLATGAHTDQSEYSAEAALAWFSYSAP